MAQPNDIPSTDPLPRGELNDHADDHASFPDLPDVPAELPEIPDVPELGGLPMIPAENFANGNPGEMPGEAGDHLPDIFDLI